MAKGRKKNFSKANEDKYGNPMVSRFKKILEKEEIFGRYFVMEGNQFDFAKHISEQEKEIMRKKVFDGFKPIKVIN